MTRKPATHLKETISVGLHFAAVAIFSTLCTATIGCGAGNFSSGMATNSSKTASAPTGTSSPTTTTPQTGNLTVTGSSTTVQVNGTVNFTVNGSGGDWAVIGGVLNGTIDTTGTYHAPAQVPNPAEIYVCYVSADEPVCATVTVVASPSTAVILKPSQATVATNGTDQILATVQGTVVTGGQWSVSGGTANGTIDSNGLYTAPATVPSPSSVTISYVVANQTFTTTVAITLAAPITVQAAQVAVLVGGTDQFTVTQQGNAVTGGQWVVLGGAADGSINSLGLYTAPSSVPNPSSVSVGYVLANQFYSAVIVVNASTAAVPSITSVTPSLLRSLSTPIQVVGANFDPSALVTVNGSPVPTTFVDAAHLSATVTLSAPMSQTIEVAVADPAASNALTGSYQISASFPSLSVQPSTLTPGTVSLSVSGAGFSAGDVVSVAGRPMQTTVVSATQITATGFLPPWLSGSVTVEVSAEDGLMPLSAISVPIAPTAVSFDAAARFSTQAAFGPRPDLVQHIQSVGFDAFITEQFQQPAANFGTGDARKGYIEAAVTGNSVLRQRVAYALGTFIVGSSTFDPAAAGLETKLENDASGNFRQLMEDVASDVNIGYFLNLADNNASTSLLSQPNQNFARELMQLFSLGPQLLNDDGSLQLDANGNTIPTYTQDTVVALTRALTGWQYPTPVNPSSTIYSMDFSQTLTANDAAHDHYAKVLFGTVTLPAGQDIVQDREAALNAIFNHPNLPPYLSQLLIQQLVTSNPSPAYIARISKVFENDGNGTRGNMAAVIRAVLLDKEARSGDTAPSPNDGFLQSPLKFQLFAMNALQLLPSDAEPDLTGKMIGEDWWSAPTVFYFFSPSYVVPGTTVHSPEFMIFNNLSLIHRSEILWGMVSSTQGGYTNDYKPTSWLFQNFTTVPAMVEALNHLLYHGQMSQTQQATIISYCSTLNPFDTALQMESAVFLALNGDSYNISN